MIRLTFAFTIISSALLAQYAAVRVDPIPIFTTLGSVAPPGYPAILGVPYPTIAVCNAPANGVPCTNYATTYTSATAATACPSNMQLILQGTTTCTSTGDPIGNFGFWITPGNYTYTVIAPSGTFGPYAFTAGSATASGTVTSFSAPAGSWPAYCVPTVTNPTTTPTLTVACANIPNSALLNSSLTIGSTNIALGATTSVLNGVIIGQSTPTSGWFTTLNITGQITTGIISQCLQTNSSGVISGSGSTCGSGGGGGGSFSAITSGTNVAAAMQVGTGASLTATGTGAIVATQAPGAGITGTRTIPPLALPLATDAAFGAMEGDGSTIICVAGVCSASSAGNNYQTFYHNGTGVTARSGFNTIDSSGATHAIQATFTDSSSPSETSIAYDVLTGPSGALDAVTNPYIDIVTSILGRLAAANAWTGSNTFSGQAIFAGVLAANISTIASASTIAPTTPFVFVTGTTAIGTMTPPTGCTTGGTDCVITLLADPSTGPYTITSAGNFYTAFSASIGYAAQFMYNPATSKWYCQACQGSVSFTNVTSGTNSASLVVAGSLAATGGGTIAATSVLGSGVTGSQSIPASTLPLGTNATVGGVKGDGSTINCVSGVCSAVSGSGVGPSVTFTAGAALGSGGSFVAPACVTASQCGQLSGAIMMTVGNSATAAAIAVTVTYTSAYGTYYPNCQVTRYGVSPSASNTQYNDRSGTILTITEENALSNGTSLIYRYSCPGGQ